MVTAAKALSECGGGLCVAVGDTVVCRLELPIAGLMTTVSPATLIQREQALYAAAQAIGSSYSNPFMPLSFLPLSVIPHLKITDRGLIDVDAFKIVGLDISPPL